MEELRDESIHHTAAKLISSIQTLESYEPIYRNVQKLACSPDVDRNDMCNTLEKSVKSSGMEIEIRNMLYHLMRKRVKPDERELNTNKIEALSFLRRAGVLWDRRVRKSLNTMCIELKISCQGQPRTPEDREELHNKWDELSNYAVDLANYRPVYAPRDVLETLLALKGPGKHVPNSDLVQIPTWEFSHIPLRVKTLLELKMHYQDLLNTESYAGGADINEQCSRVLDTKHAIACQYLLRKGNCPAPYRGDLWTYVLDSQVREYDAEHWNRLKYMVLATDHIVDKLILKDVQLTASNDDQYFVFEDVLYQVMLCFSRDAKVNEIIQSDRYPMKGKQYEPPPSGVVPFHGICMFAAPFCYLYDSPISLYFTFRSFYTRYCHRLTTINTNPQGIVSLCLLFEKLLLTHEPDLWCHLRELNIQPMRVVFKWLMRAFSGHLPPDQLLVLWDLILGFDSLEILSLFAVIILSFRQESIMQVNSLECIEAILADLSSIKVLPLIQLALSND